MNIWNFIKKNTFYLPVFFYLSILYMELVLKITFHGFSFDANIFFVLLFSIPMALLLFFICSFFKKKTNQIVAIAALSVLSSLFMIQMVYRTIFSIYLTTFTAMNGMKALQFGSVIASGIWKNIFALLLLFLPIVVLVVVGLKKWFPENANKRLAIGGVVFAILSHLICLVILPISGDTYGSAYNVYYKTINTESSVSKLGLITSSRIDIKRTLFGFQEEVTIAEEVPATPSQTTDYAKNILEIDFDALKEQTDDDELVDMHEYFSKQEPTVQNEKTGIYKDYNLIMIIAESFSPYAIHPEKTPTLYKMANEGYNFINFYNSYWEGSTIAGEYGANFGLLPMSDDGFKSISILENNNPYFNMGWQLKRQGYPVYAFHANTYDYYNRDVIYPAMGYMYYGKGNGLELKNPDAWPQSDVETIEASLPFYINGKKPFHAYYMSISGHCNYNFTGNQMSYKHMEEVADLPLSVEGQAYIACNMEFDQSLALLLEKLEEAGVAENTLIMITPDHYPYEMSDSAYDELVGHPLDRDLEIYKSTLILYAKGMTPETVDTPCSAADILPTLSNLMGLPYDSRLMSGRDIFSTAEHIVFLKGRSWVTDQAFYNGRNGEVTEQGDEPVKEEYIKRINNIVNNRFIYAGKILEHDYYNILFGEKVGP